jgi:SAM-dependent methyltransferase
VLVDHYRESAHGRASNVTYKGLAIHAWPGLHEYAFEQFARHVAPGAGVLELAAGSGAMSLRLSDAGYRVTATDYVPENFRPRDSIPFFSCDLNAAFAAGREASVDAICALEIIEHLENPRHLLRQCFRALKPGGIVLLSTPNLDNAASLVCFLRERSFQWFSDQDYAHDGHITPVSQWQMHKSSAEAGFETVWRGSFGDQFQRLRGSPRLYWLARALDRLMVREPGLTGQIYLTVLRKPQA